jgi:hypothetical protein
MPVLILQSFWVVMITQVKNPEIRLFAAVMQPAIWLYIFAANWKRATALDKEWEGR